MVTPFSLIILNEKTMLPNAMAPCFMAVNPMPTAATPTPTAAAPAGAVPVPAVPPPTKAAIALAPAPIAGDERQESFASEPRDSEKEPGAYKRQAQESFAFPNTARFVYRKSRKVLHLV